MQQRPNTYQTVTFSTLTSYIDAREAEPQPKSAYSVCPREHQGENLPRYWKNEAQEVRMVLESLTGGLRKDTFLSLICIGLKLYLIRKQV